MDFQLSGSPHISQQTSPKQTIMIPPVTLTLAKSFSEDAIQSPNANYLMVDGKYNKPYYSASEVNYDSTTDDLTTTDEFDSNDDISDNSDHHHHHLPNTNTNISYTQSEVNVNAFQHQQSRRSKRKKKKRNKNNLSRDDVMKMFNKEKKKSSKYKRESILLQSKFTNIADEYEDQLKHNEDEIKQEYEMKLLEAEIKKKELEQEVQRLKQMLITTNHNDRSSPRYSTHSMISSHSVPTDVIDYNTATMGPIPLSQARTASTNDAVMTPINISPVHQMYSDTASNHGRITPLSMTQGQQLQQEQIGGLYINAHATPIQDASTVANILSFSQLTLPLDKKEVSDEGKNSTPPDDDHEDDTLPVIPETNHEHMSMEDKLKAQMSPCVHHGMHEIIHSFNDLSKLPGYSLDGYQHSPEGSDHDTEIDKRTVLYFNNKMNHNDGHTENDDDTDDDDESIQSSDTRSYESSPSPSPSPVPPQKKYHKNKKKRKRIKEPKSFWDVLIKCVTPTLCEVE